MRFHNRAIDQVQTVARFCRQSIENTLPDSPSDLNVAPAFATWAVVDLSTSDAEVQRSTFAIDASRLPRQLVAAARPACAFENFVPHQRLEHRLELTPGNGAYTAF
jgi:hypothetical protein